MSRQPTPDILGSVLLSAETERNEISAALRYDYSQLGNQAAAVREHAIEIKRNERRANDAVVAAGRHLMAVKDSLTHGQWGEWLQTEFHMTDRTAQTLMNIATKFVAKSEIISDLSLTVLGLLAAPSVPDAAVAVVVERTQASERVTVADAKRIIAEHKLPQPPAPRQPADAELVRKHGYKFLHHPPPPYGDDSVDVLQADRQIGNLPDQERAYTAAQRDLAQRQTDAAPPAPVAPSLPDAWAVAAPPPPAATEIVSADDHPARAAAFAVGQQTPLARDNQPEPLPAAADDDEIADPSLGEVRERPLPNWLVEEPELQAAVPALPVSQREGYDSDEWYTPAWILAAARAVLGQIDLDPASCATAQAVVQAASYWTRSDDGLQQAWHGRVWLNPPYSAPDEFVTKLHNEYLHGNVHEALVLLNNATETKWFQLLLVRFPVCFLNRRLAFWRHDHADVGARQGQAVFYLGPDQAEFERVFGQYGVVVQRVS